MKRKLAALLLLVFSWVGIFGEAYAASEIFTTGKDWTEHMNPKQKFIAIFAPFILYHRYGVNFREKPEQYVEKIDKVLIDNPYIQSEDIANIFASTVYAVEPENRPAFDAMEREFRARKAGYPEYYPSLAIRPVSRKEFDTRLE